MLCGPSSIANGIMLMNDTNTWTIKGILIGMIALIYFITSLLSGEILPQRKLSRTVTLRNISSEVGLIKYIFDVASFEEDLTNRV